MKNYYSIVVAILAFITIIPSSIFAQSDCFEGPTGNKVLIDYYQGLTGAVENKRVTLLNPFEMATREFLPMGDSIAKAQSRLSFLIDRYNDAVLLADSLENVIDTSNIMYNNACVADLELIISLLNAYDSMATDIESRLNGSRSAWREKQPSDVVTDLSTFMTDWDYLQWHIDFCAEYLVDLCEEIEESATNCSEDLDEAGERINLWANILETLSNNCLSISNYYEQNYNDLSYSNLIELQNMIYEQAESLTAVGTEIQDNADMPIDKEFALKFIIETANSTAGEMNEAIGELSALSESFNNIKANFMPVLMGFTENATTGMYINLTHHNWVLELPSEMTFVDEGGTVVSVDGNIFGESYPDGFPGLNSIVIPSSVESIKNGAFRIEGIQSVSVKGNSVPELQPDCFTDNVYANAVLYVDDKLKSAFAAHPSWSRFQRIESLQESDVDTVDTERITVKVSGMKLSIECAENDNVTVWSSNGNLISAGECDVELPCKGVYIVKVGSRIVKIVC